MKQFNDRLALFITKHIGTMYCAYLFAIIGVMGMVGAFTGNTKLVLIVGAVSGYFLQLVLLPIIMVGQDLQATSTKEHITAKHEEMKAHVTHHLGK